MRTEATTQPPTGTDADTICIGLLDDEPIAHDVEGGALQALVDSGEARSALRKLAHTHVDGRRVVLVGLGARAELDPERLRVAAAAALGRARELGARVLCWELPHHVSDAGCEGIVEGTLLAAYAFDAFKATEPEQRPVIERLLVSAHHDVADAVATGTVLAEAQNAARDLQNRPPNELTPTALGQRALELAGELDGLEAEVEGRDGIEGRGMGAFAAVARGSDEEPALIVLRYEGPGSAGPRIGLVGKAVTFDSGGISLKPGMKMSEMKYDMSGGAAVIEAVGAAARLRLPVSLVAVVGATENLPSGHALKPSDIVRARSGTSIEIINTDAEGRLVLADCLTHAIELGAERLVDLATLTGAMLISLGSVMAGLLGTDDAWCRQVADAGTRAGERVWRLPLDPAYAETVRGQHADLRNAVEDRKAGSIVAAEFLHAFVDDVPWAHLDIAGVANDNGRAYAPKGGSGFGVRLLVELLRGTPD